MEKIKKFLIDIAEKTNLLLVKDFDIGNYSGDNLDDAFSLGVDCGEVCLARQMLSEFFGLQITNDQEKE